MSEKIDYKKEVIKLALLVEREQKSGAATTLELINLQFRIIELNLTADRFEQDARIADALEDLAVLLKDDQRQKVSEVVTEGIKKQVLGRRNKGRR